MDTDVTPYVIHGVAGLRERAGSALGTSRWVTIDQEMVTTFAHLSGDRQWIHIDPERARQGPFGSTVAHGFFTLSLSTDLLHLLLGEVSYERTVADSVLSDDEKVEGICVSCRAVPLTDVVIELQEGDRLRRVLPPGFAARFAPGPPPGP
jgi:hypothetical protein